MIAEKHHLCFESTVKEGSSMAFATPSLTLCLNTGVFPTNPMKNHIRTGFLPLVLTKISDHRRSISCRRAGSMVALSFFYWAIGFAKFRHFMRFYVVTATSLIENGNSERAHEVMRCMVRNLAEIGRLKEAVSMVIEMRNQGLEPCTQTLNCLIGVAIEMSSIELARKVFVEMSERGALPDSCTFKILTISYCKSNEISHLVRSESYKPNVLTYTAMITGYCKEGKVNRAEMLLTRMQEQGLVPNENTYTTLINGHCKNGNLDRAFELINEMKKEGLPPNMYTYNAIINRLFKKGMVQEAYEQLDEEMEKLIMLNEAKSYYDAMIEKGLVPCEVTRLTIAYEYCKVNDLSTAMEVVDSLEKKLWVRTVNTLVRKLCSEKKVEVVVPFVHKLIDKEKNLDRIMLMGFVTACYDSNHYAIVSDISERISNGIG
ncbi:hypothetical protein L2E82_40794 [Cichorium intybus]|uniref:Uncharacterized protein n=1 Tax=Cichorium intybus TaxID=13427 RepID=A0ACB9AMR5_CICIN|nr:hypothetical protein L2E82_40794 [Cichorium intybus]